MDQSEKIETAFDDRDEKKTGLEAKTQASKETTSKEESREKILEKPGPVRTVPRPGALPNKPWEPPFKLKLNPPDFIKLRWQRGVSIFSEMTITNTLTVPQCYKMKCTDNAQFRVRPPMNFIDKGATVTVKIIHNSYVLPEPNKHYFAVYHVKCQPEDVRNRNFKRIWKASTVPDGVIRIPIAFETAEIKISNTMQPSGPPTSSTITSSKSKMHTGKAPSGSKTPVGGRKSMKMK